MSVDARARYREDFRRDEAAFGRSVPWLRALREQALEKFLADGLPTTRQEEWKYTDTLPIRERHFGSAARGQVGADQLRPFQFDARTLVFVDGRFAVSLSSPIDMVPGAHLSSLAQTLEQEPAAIEPWLASAAPPSGPGFAALNLALMRDGAFLRIAPETSVQMPIHLLFVSTAQPDSATHVRNVIVIGSGAQATVVENYVSLANGSCLTNVHTDVVLQSGAALEHYRVEREGPASYHVGATRVRQQRKSSYRSHSITLGSQLARHELHGSLEGEEARCELNGLYVGGDRQHMDHHTRIDHHVARGTSREWYRGILDDRARGVFSGRVVVHPQAQQTDAEQSSRALLLSPHAEADCRPQFEIYADSVKCAHGASTGSLDPDALFYLRARGLDESRARQLLVYGFAAESLARMTLAPVRVAVEAQLTERLLGGRGIEGKRP